MKLPSIRDRASSMGLALLLLLALMILGVLTLWGSDQSHSASANELALLYDPYPARIPIIVFDPAPTLTPVPTPTPVPTATPIPPKPMLFLGERNTWDGKGFIRIDEYSEVGVHEVAEFNAFTAPDVIRSLNHFWYDPNPHDFEENEWYEYYAPLTGRLLSTSAIGDAIWKFGYPTYMPSDVEIIGGQTLSIDGQPFSVRGPYGGVTAFGQPVNYWLLENLYNILYMDDENGLTQIVRPRNLELHYDAGHSGVLLFSDVLRHFYYYGSSTGYNVQYTQKLTSSNAIPGPVNIRLLPSAPAQKQTPGLSAVTAAERALATQVGVPLIESLQWRPPMNP